MKTPPLRPVATLAWLAGLLFTASSLSSAEKNSGGSVDRSNALRPVAADVPVPPPAEIDPRYTPAALTEAFRILCQRLGVRIVRLSVDQSEYPFLVHGVLDSHRTHHEIRDALKTMRGYVYIGSATSLEKDNTTCFALSMTPATEYPRAHRVAILQRLGFRLQELRDAERRR